MHGEEQQHANNTKIDQYTRSVFCESLQKISGVVCADADNNLACSYLNGVSHPTNTFTTRFVASFIFLASCSRQTPNTRLDNCDYDVVGGSESGVTDEM